MNISIVTPVYNEKDNILKVLDEIEEKVKNSHEVLIIYDFPEDNTLAPARKYIKKSGNRNIKLTKNNHGSGKGVMNAIKTGFDAAKGEAVVVVMADLSDDISQIDRMFSLISKGYDMVCGSRYMPGGKKIGGPLIQSLLSKSAGLIFHYFFGLPTHDMTNAFKMYRRGVLDKIPITSTGGFEYSMEITLKAFRAGYKIIEIPTVWRDRTAGKSNFKLLKWLPHYLRQCTLIWKNSVGRPDLF